MFDIKKAAAAALGITRDRTRKIGFVRFLERASETDIPACQWRAVGGDADIIEKFLAEVGFTAEDYSVDVSRLDPSVRTFRWGSTGKYDALRAALAAAVTGFSGEDGDLFTAMAFRASYGLGDDEIVAGLGGELLADGTTVSGGPAAVDMLDLAAATAARYAEYNGRFPDDRIVPGDEAVPDLSVIEKICRKLELVALTSGVPDDPVFAPEPGGRQVRTVMRHLGFGEVIKYANMYAGTVVPAAFQRETARDGGKNVLRGYLYRDKETCSKVKTESAAGVVLFGCEEVRRDAHAYSFTSFPGATHRYVRTLYSRFFGIPLSHVGIAPWSVVTYPFCGEDADVTVYAGYNQDVTEAAGLLGMNPDGLVAFKFCVTLGRAEAAGSEFGPYPSVRDGDARTGVSVVEEADDEHGCATRAVTSDDLEGEWYSYIHRWRGDARNRWRGISCDGSGNVPETMARMRREWHRRRTERALLDDASFDDNASMQIEFDRCAESSPVAVFLVHAGLALRSAAAAAGADLVRTVKEGRPGDHLVSRVFTSIVEGGSSSPDDVVSDPETVSAYLEDAHKGQVTGRRLDAKHDVYRLVVETNVSLSRDLSTDVKTRFVNDVADYFASDIVYGGSYRGLSDTLCTEPCYRSEYNHEARYFRAGVTSGAWFGYNPVTDMTGLPTINAHGSHLDRLTVAVGADKDGRLVIVIDVSGRVRNMMMTSFRVRLLVPPVDAYGIIRLSPADSDRNLRTIVCREDERQTPEMLNRIVDRICSSCSVSGSLGWTQAADPFYGRGRMFCHAEYSHGFCPEEADFRRTDPCAYIITFPQD